MKLSMIALAVALAIGSTMALAEPNTNDKQITEDTTISLNEVTWYQANPNKTVTVAGQTQWGGTP